MKNLRFVSDRQRRLTVIFFVVLVVILSSLLVAARSGANRAKAVSASGERTARARIDVRSLS